jgi:uncharacterized membrane protein YkvA (DUF1232 family)
MTDTTAIVSGAVDESEPPKRRDLTDVAAEGLLLLPNTVKLVSRLVRDPRVSIRRKMPVGAAVVYAVSPLNISPRSTAGFGLIGDAVIVSLALNALLITTDPEIISEHWDGSIDALDLAMSVMRWGASLVPGRV